MTDQIKNAVVGNIRWALNKFVRDLNGSFRDLWYKNRTTKQRSFRLNNVDFGVGTFVKYDTYYERFFINVDVNDVIEYAKVNGIKVSYAAKLLCSHEIYHILLGHLSEKYKDHDKKILNIAGDLEINSFLGLKHPGIVPSDFNLPELFTTDYYYQKILEQKKENDKKKKDETEDNFEGMSLPTNSDAENEFDSEANGDSEFQENAAPINSDFEEEETEEETDDNKTAGENDGSSEEKKDEFTEEFDLPEDVKINTRTFEENEGISIDGESQQSGGYSKGIEDASKIIKKHLEINKEEYKNWNLDGLDEIIRNLERKEKSISIKEHGRQSTYYKLNNRRKSEFLLPGKKLTGEGTRKKYTTGLTCFIDVSGSTGGIIHKDLSNTAHKLHKLGATIVYYRSGVSLIVKPDDPFVTVGPSGCTDIKQTISEYLQDNELNRAYIFTDGEDDFSGLGEVCDKYKVFIILGDKIKEKFNDKKPCVGRFSWRDF